MAMQLYARPETDRGDFEEVAVRLEQSTIFSDVNVTQAVHGGMKKIQNDDVCFKSRYCLAK